MPFLTICLAFIDQIKKKLQGSSGLKNVFRISSGTLIGQAVSFYRPLGRERLRLRCAPYNSRAQHFYAKYGFQKIGEEQGSRVPLDILEKYIGYGEK